MSGILVVHALGPDECGRPWLEAFTAAGFDDVVAPDLPGHGDAAAPVGGNYVRALAGFTVARLVADGLDLTDRTVVGVGHGGWVASLLAIADAVPRIVLADGLGTPWTAVEDRMARRRATMRSMLTDAASMDFPDGSGPDPRLAHGIDPHGDEALATEAAGLVRLPVLVLQPDPADVAAVTPAFSDATVEANDCTPSAVADAVAAWLT